MALNVFITGTDTGVGKTVLSVLLTRTLRARGVDVVAVKPLCSGGRDDAEALLAAQMPGDKDLDSINPWCFREALTPMVAARRAGRPVLRKEVAAFLRESARDAKVLLVEGAGGLLSPLGEDFDARDLILETGAVPVIVAANRLGMLNHVLLTWDALPRSTRKHAKLAMMPCGPTGLVEKTNEAVLVERLGADRIHRMPRLSGTFLATMTTARIPRNAAVALDRLAESLTG